MKRAIVVGATSGIGLHVALLLARQGWQVGIAGRRQELLDELCACHKGIVATRRIDVTHEAAAQELQSLIAQLGGMDLYLHSSGIGWQNPALEPEKELATVETNALGFTRLVDAAFRYFARQGHGHIAAISSIAGTKGLGAAPAYSATKRFQQHYLECLTQLATIRRLDIHVTDIRPGFVATALIAHSNFPLQLQPEPVARQIVEAICRRRSVVTIDWRYRLLVLAWRLLPRRLWVRLRVATKAADA